MAELAIFVAFALILFNGLGLWWSIALLTAIFLIYLAVRDKG